MVKKYGCKLKEIRLKEYMQDNRSEFARMLNTPLQTYTEWENERSFPIVTKAIEVSKILNKAIEEIWYEKE